MNLFIKRIPKQESNDIKSILKNLGINSVAPLNKGELVLKNVSEKKAEKIRHTLTENGYRIATGKKEILSERLKMIIRKMLWDDHMPVVNVSAHIAEETGHNYSYLSNVFSDVNGLTIEHYIIRCRIARAKKMLRETSADIGKIAGTLHYSSNAHFSAQFKKETGFSPSAYKRKTKQQPVHELH